MGKWFQNKSFSTEKQEQGIKARKGYRGINARKIHRALGILLAAALVFQTVPFDGIAVSASESSGGGLCEHHRPHTPDCGYKEAEPGHACTHKHTEECYRTVEGEDGSTTKEPDCHHEHDESCGYREAAEGSPCTFVCEICSGGTDKIPEDKTDDNEINDGESENPGTENGDEVKEPDDGQEECTCEEPCTEDSINTDCPVCGAEDASLSDCKGKDTEDSTEDAEENTKQPEDTGICKHHQEHDDACGYLPESEDSDGSPCTYECRICPIEDLIAALPDKVTEDNAEDVRGQLDEILALFGELTEDEQEQIDLSRVYELQGALDGANDPNPITESVEYQEASWDGSQVTYESKTETCTLVENSTEAIEWTAGWYAVSGTVTIDQPITVTDAVNLILTDGCDLTAAKGIVVTDGNSLTIYAQSDGTGTLNATGTVSGQDSSAGIGGSATSFDSGSITIHGGVINAVSGEGYYAGAGIGGGSNINGNGGTGNDITIYGGSVTAESRTYEGGGAGVGGGAGGYNGGAGNITIRGGTVRATGGKFGAGIGGGTGGMNQQSGNGTVTISGGEVTAVGGSNAAGIGGGGGYQGSYNMSLTGGAGTVTITGGIVDASSPTDVGYADYKGAPIGNGGNASGTATVNKTTGIVFENKVGTVCGSVVLNENYAIPAGYSLHIPAGASLSGSGTLSGGGRFTADLSEDMISVPTDLYFNGQDRSNDIKTRLSVGLTQGIAICGQTFTVSGWTVEVSKTDEMTYTATYTNTDNSNTFQKTIKLQKSGTQFVGDGTVKTYKDGAECSDFTADDTITVKATPTATGKAPAKAAARLRGAPTNGQMAVFVGDIQVSGAASANLDGSYTMTVNASDVLEQGNVEPNGGPVTLTAKFVGNDNMADAYGTVDVKISAVAKVEKNGSTTYVDAAHFANTIAPANGNDATFTMLQDVMLTGKVNISCSNLVLDLNGHSITVEKYFQNVSIYPVTIKDSKGGGAMISQTTNALLTEATGLTIEGGTFRGAGGNTGLYIQKPIVLAGGTFEGIECVLTTLKEQLKSGYCYYDQNNKPIALTNEQTNLTGTVTVKPCTHDKSVCEYTHATGTTTHQQTCLACGKKWDEEDCSYVDGECACGSTLSVALTGTEKLVYDGNSHEPGVTVTLDGTKLTAAGYDITYANNINAGTDTATVTVTGKGNYSFEIKKTFSIEKAEQKDFAVVEKTTQYEKNGTLTLSTTGEGGDGTVLYRVPENNGVLMVNGDQATIIGVGTVTVTATKAESENYKAATATGTIRITKAPAPAITYPAVGSITYGQKLSDCALTGGSTEYGTFAWENGSTIPAVDNTGYTVVFTASEETKKNYETITNTTKSVSVKVEKAAPAVSVTAAVSGSKDNRQAVITVNVAKAGAGAFPTGTVTFIDCTGSTEVKIGTATLSNGSASYTWDGLRDKTYTIKAVYTGNDNYKEAGSRELTFDAAKQNQQDFALDAIGAKTYGDAPITLKTTGGSGNGAVRYESSDEDVIRIEDGRAVIVGAGTATITAIKEGDDNYNEASAGRNVTVAKKALTVRADSKTVVRGNPMPALTYRADGLVNGDTFTAAPSITAGVQNTDTLGKYDIVINGGTLQNSESYSITYVNGTLNIVERFYTVTVTDGTGGGEYAEGDTVTVTANDRSGYTFTGWSSGDGVAFADSKAKNTTFTMPAKSVTVKANYTRNSSGGNNGGGSGDGGNSGGTGGNSASGGNSDDNGNNGGGENSGGQDSGSISPGNGTTAPQISAIPSAGTGSAPGTGTTLANSGKGNAAKPGTSLGSGAGTPAGTKQPFIKGADGKIGWDVIRAEEEKAQEGSVINVDMNGSVVVPGDIFDSIKGKDITITFDMGNGILWSVDGKSITRDASRDKAGDIDFSVKKGVNTVPVDIVNNVTGESYSIQISLAYEGEFGFTAILSIDLGRENAGLTASLYYYNESTKELEFICKDRIAQDGTASLTFTHASDYVIKIDAEQEEDNSSSPEGTAPETGEGDSVLTGRAGGGAGQESRGGKAWPLIVAAGAAAAAGIAIYLWYRKKKRKEGEEQP